MGALFRLFLFLLKSLFFGRAVHKENETRMHQKAGISALLDGRACWYSGGSGVVWLVSGSFAANMLPQF